MRLDKVTAELRPRGPWEAADFGVRLVRREAPAVYRAWFAASLPLLALALSLVYLSPWPGLAILVYWWLEPVVDGPVLDILARRLFGGDANVKATVRATLRLAWRNKLFLLTPWRFHFARSIAMPLTQLEGLAGDERRKRATTLNNSILNQGIGLTVAYHHLVSVVYLGVLLGALTFIPVEYRTMASLDGVLALFESDSRHASAANLLLFYLAQTLLQPWFVGAGFGLYVNCRTRLEAWDIEVAFRRLVANRVAGVLLALCAGFVLLVPAPADAADDPGFAGYWFEQDYREPLDAVLADDAFDDTETRMIWKPNFERDRSTPEADGGFLESLAVAFSYVIEFGLWILLALLLLWLVLTRDQWLPYLRGSVDRPARRQRKVVLASGEITAESLPADVPSSVRALWTSGRHREALSLLYRASVFESVNRYDVRVPDSATEGVCLDAVVAGAPPSGADYFKSVVDAWVRLAYGARQPSAEQLERLLSGYRDEYEATS